MQTCGVCGTLNPDRARFCNNCGSPLTPAAAEAREARKTVTVVFCDVTGSTSIGERADPEAVRRIMGRWFDAMRAVLVRHGGTVEKFIGDAVMAVFGIPEVHEDDALRAVRAALEMRDGLSHLNDELEANYGVRLQVRTGVNTGPVVAGDPSAGQNLVTGDTVNVAARLEQAAAPGEILLGPATHRLVRDAVFVEVVEPLTLKGKSSPLPAVRLLEVVPGAPGRARRLDAPLVGREQELRLLLWSFSRAVRERACHLVTVLGAAGVGKSRLVAEASAALSGRAIVLKGECPAYGEGITYWPVVEIVRAGLDIADDAEPEEVRRKLAGALGDDPDAGAVADRLVGLVGRVPEPVPVRETAWAVRRLLEAAARRRPVLIVLDDLHWAEPTMLDLVEHVTDWTRDAPILVICVARPELLEQRPSWGGGKMNASSLLLEPLTEPETEQLLVNLLDRAELAEEARDRIMETAEGNPLFVEEMLAMLLDDRLLTWDDGCWRPTVDLAATDMPPTISALLAARLDRLSPTERRVLERAAVIGKVFEEREVAALTPEAEGPGIESAMEILDRRGLVRFERGQTWSFRHLLIRDAAHESLPKAERAVLHERYADWLEARSEEGSEELVGHHLEEAVKCRSALGPLDAAGRAVAERASVLLAAAGRRALAREDMPAAASYLVRSVVAAEQTGQPEPADRLSDAGLALMEASRLSDAAAMLKRAAGAVGADPVQRANIRLRELRLALHADPQRALRTADADLQEVIDVLTSLGDEAGVAQAWGVLCQVNWGRGRVAEAAAAAEQAVIHARVAGDELEEASNLGELASIWLFGPTPVDEGIRNCEAILARPNVRPSLEGRTLRALGALKALAGDVEEGRAMVIRSHAIFEDLGWKFYVAGALQVRGVLEMVAGDFVAAEVALRACYEILRQAGDRSYMSTGAAGLAAALAELGRDEEAEDLARISADAAAESDVDSQMGWRVVLATIKARRGEADEAARLAREAAALTSSTDLILVTDVHLEVANVLASLGQTAEAEEHARLALSGYLGKRNKLGEARARRVLARLTPAPA